MLRKQQYAPGSMNQTIQEYKKWKKIICEYALVDQNSKTHIWSKMSIKTATDSLRVYTL